MLGFAHFSGFFSIFRFLFVDILANLVHVSPVMKTEISPTKQLTHGDTVIFEGKTITVGKHDLISNQMGECFRGVNLKIIPTIERVLYKTWRKGKFIGYTTQP